MELYNCKLAKDGYRITKFTKDFEVQSSYIVTSEGCECPRGDRPTCRHRQMLPKFVDEGKVDAPLFLEWETRLWRMPSQAILDAITGHNEDPENVDLSSAQPPELEARDATDPSGQGEAGSNPALSSDSVAQPPEPPASVVEPVPPSHSAAEGTASVEEAVPTPSKWRRPK